jgi:pimeloyl-[acyl-carrier protein] methyl ester esterase
MSALGERRLLRIADIELESFHVSAGSRPTIAAAHPADVFGAETAALIARMAGTQVVTVSPRGIGGSTASDHVSLEQMVDDLEAVRLQLNREPWIFWGMSGGGWLALLYAQRHPAGVAGIIVESACLCFRERLGDPACALSPYFPAWRDALERGQMLRPGAHDRPSDLAGARWVDVAGVGQVLRGRDGAALLCSPAPLAPPMRRALPAFWAFDARSWASSLRVPALVLAGTADPVVPLARARAVHEAIVDSRFLAIDGGHVPTVQEPPAIAAAVRKFVAGLG